MSADGGAPHGALPDRAPPVHPAAHVRHVTIGKDTIVLDLRRDRYLSAPADLFEALCAGRIAPHEAPLGQQLIAQGLLTTDDVQAAPDATGPIVIGLHFVASCLWAQQRVRTRRLDLALEDLSTMRVKTPDDASARADRVECFREMRPWYPKRPVCLFDSLALMHFLVSAGHRAELVLGVRTEPFAAHAWVEADERILNDEPLYCASFTEILRAP